MSCYSAIYFIIQVYFLLQYVDTYLHKMKAKTNVSISVLFHTL
jgi:hypothetical protein